MSEAITMYLGDQCIFALRLLLACICGGMIGYERQQRTKFAGIRTHIIICMAAALMMLISKHGFLDVVHQGINYDVSRVAAGIIAGMGILGGGVVISNNKQGTVSGITTAAGIWVTIAIGMCAGAGMYVMAIFSTLLVELIQGIFHKDFLFLRQHIRVSASFRMEPASDKYQAFVKKMEEKEIQLSSLKWDRKGQDTWTMKCQAYAPILMKRDEVLAIFTAFDELETIELS